MVIYGNTISFGGGGGSNDTLPPLLNNFSAAIDESQTGQVVLSADKIEERRAKDLAGAVWVYGDHAPKNANDGTRIELTRDEVIKPDFIPPITLADIPVSDADTETVVNLKESDGKLHPYLYLSNNHNDTVGGLPLRKNIGTVKGVWCSWKNNPASDTYRYWCENEFMKKILDPSVSSHVINGNIKANFSNSDSGKTELGSVKCFALSLQEYGLQLGDSYIKDEGPHLSYFSNDSRRIAYNDAGGAIEHYTRTTTTATGYTLNTSGQYGSELMPKDVPHGLRPAIFLPFTFKLNATPNKDGSYDMYEESSVQTLATGKTIADLPSKTKVKLGRYGSKDLIWLTTKNIAQEQFLILSPESTAISPFAGMMLDNAEPTNPNSARKKSGSNRYIHSNLHQWLNSDKPANEWYTAQHEYDAPPDYTNIRGFLYEWSDVEKNALSNRQWKVAKAKLDGSGDETFFAKVIIPTTIEVGYGMKNESEFLEIFQTNDDRVCNDKNWWLRSPYTDYDDTNMLVYQYGSKYQYPVIQKYLVRPLVNIDPYTPVSENPDSDGCYTLILSQPIAPNAIVTKNILWDTNKNFYARQFTYNAKKHYQTLMDGAVAFLSRPTMRIGDLPSKSVIRLGRGKEFTGGELLDFTWHTTKDKVGNQYLVLMGLQHPRFAVQYGSAANDVGAARRFDYSVLCQWVNADKASGEWFVPNQYNESMPAIYNDMDGFLHYWTEKEKGVLRERSWKLDEGERTTITNYFFGKVFVPTKKNVAVAAVGESAESDDNLDIFTSDSDRIFPPGRQWWTSTPYYWDGSTETIFCVGTSGGYSGQRATGTAYVRPIVNVSPDTPVYADPDENGVYSFCLENGEGQ